MTQITKTLSIAGIIALATAPAMADIASTQYVQNIVNNIPKPAAATASSAGLTKLYTGVGTNTDGTMTQAAIKTELDKKLGNASQETDGVAIGKNATTAYDLVDDEYQSAESVAIGAGAGTYGWGMGGSVAIGKGASATAEVAYGPSVAIGYNASTSQGSTAIGGLAKALGDEPSIAIGQTSEAEGDGSVAIGESAKAEGDGSIQLGTGTNDQAGTFQVFGTTLLGSDGVIPTEALPEGILLSTATGEDAIAIGTSASASGFGGTAIGPWANATEDMSTAVGHDAYANGYGSIQLGPGSNDTGGTLSVGLGDMDDDILAYISYTLLNYDGTIPAGRLTAGRYDENHYFYENNGVSGQILQTNGDGTMSWVDAPSAPTLASLLPALPSACNTVKCALVHDNTDGAYKWEVVKVSE